MTYALYTAVFAYPLNIEACYMFCETFGALFIYDRIYSSVDCFL